MATGIFLANAERVFKPSLPLVVCFICLVDCQMNGGSVVIRNSMVGNGQKIRSSSLPRLQSMSTKLYVGNLPFASTAQDLQDLFSQAGAVASVDLILDKFTGRSRGFAFVEMSTPAEAQAAIEKFNGFAMDNRNLTVNEARPREERAPRQFDGGGERRGGFGDERRGGFGGERGERRGGDRDRGFRR
jgi:RNA recognition motif-containing protein